MFLKRAEQRNKDRNRVTYQLSFPADMTTEQVVAWLRAISGTLRSAGGFSGVPTVAFEMWSTEAGIKHRIKIPWQHAPYILPQLLTHIPGMRYTPEEEWPSRDWTQAVEVGMSHPGRQLFVPSPESMAASLLTSVGNLDGPETILVQLVMAPALRSAPPIHRETPTDHINARTLFGSNQASRDEVNDRRRKLEEPNMVAVMRVAAFAETDDRAQHLLHNVRKAVSQTQTAAMQYKSRLVTRNGLQERLQHASAPLHWPMALAATELAALLGWPIGAPNVAGLPQALARHLPTPEMVPKAGRIIGRSTFPGRERKIAISHDEALKHMHVMGPTGAGKTALLANMLRQDVEQGYGAILIESKGDLFEAALHAIPAVRLKDVIVLDVNDTSMPVGFNILREGNPAIIVDELLLLFNQLFKDNPSLWTQEVLYHGLHTLLVDPANTFIDLAPLIAPNEEDENWREKMTRLASSDPQLRTFWQRLENKGRQEQDRITQPVMSRIWPLYRSKLRNILGQSESSFHMRDVIEGNKILLVNLSNIEKEAASLMGTLLMNAIWSAVKTTRGAKPNFLYLDEFQDFINLPVDARDMLAKARSFGLGMVLAHQHLGQLPHDLQLAISANARSKIVFQAAAADAKSMANEFGASVSVDDFMNLSKYEAIAKVSTSQGISPPLTLATLPPAKPSGLAGRLLYESRQTYGRPRTAVEEAMYKRRADVEPLRRRSRKSSDQSWG